MYDFHTHTFLSDGVLSPIELIRRACVHGYKVIGVTDHAGPGNLELVVKTLVAECVMASARWDILAIPGVELTHIPLSEIPALAQRAKALGARLVVVHGETIVEPVEPGTNRAALASPDVDVLAHPGLVTLEEARMAASGGIFLEVSARRGHSLTNGHVVRMAQEAGAHLVLDSDAHEPEDLLTQDLAHKIALGAGLGTEEAALVLEKNPVALLGRLGLSNAGRPGGKAPLRPSTGSGQRRRGKEK